MNQPNIGIKNYTYERKAELRLRYDKELRFPEPRLSIIIKPAGRAVWVGVRTRKIFRGFSRYALEQLSGKKLPDGFEVHHINKKPLNNRFSNFLVCTIDEHASLHLLIEQHNMRDYLHKVRRLRRRMKNEGFVKLRRGVEKNGLYDSDSGPVHT